MSFGKSGSLARESGEREIHLMTLTRKSSFQPALSLFDVIDSLAGWRRSRL